MIPCLAEIDMPVEPHDIAAGLLDDVEHGCRTFDKVDDRDVLAVQTVNQLGGVRQNIVWHNRSVKVRRPRCRISGSPGRLP